MSRGPAMWTTALALALINLGVAMLIVQVLSVGGFAPAWVGVVILVAGVAAALGAVQLWRQYLAEAGRGTIANGRRQREVQGE